MNPDGPRYKSIGNSMVGTAVNSFGLSGLGNAPSNNVNNAYGLRVALNPAGQGLLAWEQERGDGSAIDAQPVDVWVRQVGTAGSWGTGSIVSASGGHADTA